MPPRPPRDAIAATLGRKLLPEKPVEFEFEVDVAKVVEQATRARPSPPAEQEQVAPLSDYLWETILVHVSGGMPLANACRLEAVDPRRVNALLRARPDLASQVYQAKNQLLKEMIGVVVGAAKEGEYRAAQWVVGRLDPPKPAKQGPGKQQTLDMTKVLEIKNKSLEDLRLRTQA